MPRSKRIEADSPSDMPALAISPEKVCSGRRLPAGGTIAARSVLRRVRALVNGDTYRVILSADALYADEEE